MPIVCDRTFVTLQAGLIVPVAAVFLLLELEARGLALTHDGDDILVRPAGRLTNAERAALRRWRPHILALLDSGTAGSGIQ